MPKASSDTTTGMKMMVRTASSIVSAISFGVFCRLAPSTRVIIRSKKVWPRSAVMRMTIRSERTLVPPVTAERSPPDSRITGADSPVIADSSTDAMPSVISPSEGMRSLASQTTMSPLFSSAAATSSSVPSAFSRRASVSERILRRVSAWALPRPSAMASAKLAKITVRKSQIVIDQVKTDVWAIASTKMTIEPTSTTNMTGLRICTAGFSLVNESTRAWGKIGPWKRLRASATPCGALAGPGWSGWVVVIVMRRAFRDCSLEESVAELLDDRAERKSREEGQTTDDDDDADGETHEHGVVGAERAEPLGHDRLGGQHAAEGQGRDHDPVAADQHVDRADDVVEGGVPGEPTERRAVVVPLRGQRVENLAEPMGNGVEGTGASGMDRHGDGREDQPGRRHDKGPEPREFALFGRDLLPQVLRCSSDHEAADEHRDDGVDEDGVKAAARATRGHLAQHHPADE